MEKPIRIQITGKDGFWADAFHIEWKHQFPDKKIAADDAGFFLIDPNWLADVERVAEQCICRIVRAPDRPERRRWLRSFIGS